jgi:hypothetical protein
MMTKRQQGRTKQKPRHEMQKPRHEMSINELIRDSGWFPGTESDWKALSLGEREDIAFAATGCAVAYATWEKPVNCVHTGCMIRRGELPAIANLNRQMRAEASSGWWRFIEDRHKLACIFRKYRKLARERGVYDLWKLGAVDVAMLGILE